MSLYGLELSAFFSEVGVAQGCRRLIFPTLADAQNNQDDEGHYIGQNLVDLRRDGEHRHPHIHDHQSAEQDGAPDGTQGTPQGEDDQRHRQPALAVHGVSRPVAAAGDHGEVQAAQAADAAADAGEQVLVSDDVDAGGVRRGRVFAHRAQVQSHSAPIEHPSHGNGDDNAQVDHEVVGEEQLADDGDVGEEIGKELGGEQVIQVGADDQAAACLDAIVFAEKLAKTHAEDGQRQASDVLVGAEGDGEEGENEAAESGRQEAG